MSGSAVFGYAESDSEDELPAGWEERTTLDGRVYYANHGERTTQWIHPRTGKRKRLVGDLPPGWERTTLEDGRILFVNHCEGKTTFTDPRLAFAIEESDKRSADVPRQKYDASTKALQILHGLDLVDKTVLITGANSGIGFETARCLALHNAHVIMACRSVSSAEIARSRILKLKPNANIDILECDLASLDSVRRCAKRFLSNHWPLHVLILNAAVFGAAFELTTDTNLELTFATNHLGHFYLTQLLTDALVQAAPSRVVVVSSESHRQAPMFGSAFVSADSLTLEQLSPRTPSSYWWLHAYNVSKFCNILFAAELNRRLYSKKITAVALHPGNMVYTALPRQSCFMRLLFTLVRPFTKSVEQGAATTVFCAVASELEGVGGQYFNNCWFCEPQKQTEDEALQKKLWDISAAVIQRFESAGSSK